MVECRRAMAWAALIAALSGCGKEPTEAVGCAATNSCPAPPSPPPPQPVIPPGLRAVAVSPREIELRVGTLGAWPTGLGVLLVVDRPAGAPVATLTSSVSESRVVNSEGSSTPVPLLDDQAFFFYEGVSPGTAVVRFTIQTAAATGFLAASRTDSVIVRVVQSSVARIILSDSVRVRPNARLALFSTLFDDLNNLMSDTLLTWSTSDSTVASVIPADPDNGVAPTLLSRREGSAVVRASAGRVSASMTVVVTSAPAPLPAAISFISVSIQADRLLAGTTADATINVGTAGQQTSVAFDTVQSANPGVADASLVGSRTLRVTGRSAGATTVRLVVTGEGSGVTRATRSRDVPVVVYATSPTLGRGFGDEQFALIPPGVFTMGALTSFSDQRPLRTVSITRPFRLQRTEVTRAQWRSVMDTVPPPTVLPACGDSCPVDAVAYTDVQDFLRRLNARDPGKRYRLPTEAEWEYAARAGETGLWPRGSGGIERSAWIFPFVLSYWPVGLLAPNAFGLHDMLGNASEWVADWYGITYFAFGGTVDPAGPDSTGRRVVRGGGVAADSTGATLATRLGLNPGGRAVALGFRVARDP
jgi:formylglycine-generating enzyme required for sulfatase activity